MALAFYFAPPTAMSRQQYDETIVRLKKAGAGHPSGRVYHAAFGTNESVKVFDVWTSQAAFDRFGQTLLPIMQQLGLEPAQPVVMDVHNVITPPKARPRPALKPAKKRAPARRAAPAKGQARRGKGKKR